MKRALVFLVIISLVLLLIIVLLPVESSKSPPATSSYQTQENSEGAVTVSVTPLSLSTKADVKFALSLETHSVELNYDLKNLAVLSDDKAKEYKALNWTGGVGGHHLEGELSFPPINKNTKTINLKIFSIDKIDRVFSWNL